MHWMLHLVKHLLLLVLFVEKCSQQHPAADPAAAPEQMQVLCEP
jgi:hypothetical protein